MQYSEHLQNLFALRLGVRRGKMPGVNANMNEHSSSGYAVHAATLVLAATLLGCSSAGTSNTARTATEQLLISNAIDNSLDKVDFAAVNGQRVYFQEKYVDCVDKSYVLASMRHRIMKSGGHLVDKPEDADMVLELRAGAVGTNVSESFVGLPEIALPGMLTIPEVRLFERKMQKGTAKFGLVAYDSKSNEILGSGGMSLAESDDSNWYFAGLGPFQSGTMRSEVERSTSGNAAVVRDRLPPTVVFAQPISTQIPPAELVDEPVTHPLETPGTQPVGFEQQ